jgi:AraC-like DNA-binding protein
VPIVELLPPPPWPTMPRLRLDGGGAPTRVVCGYLRCEEPLFNPFLKALPPLIHLKPSSAAADWLQASLRYALDEAMRDSHGARPLLERLPEVLLIDCLRQYAASLSPRQTGWLAALRDPIVGRSLALLHAQPARRWSVDLLAREAASSRSVLGERFSTLLAESPMRYLTHWRLQLAAHELATTEAPVSVIAMRLGYESEAAFSRAFKRRLGRSPVAWRSESRSR